MARPADGPSEAEPAEWTPPPLIERWRQGDIADLRRYLRFGHRSYRRWDARARRRLLRSGVADRVALSLDRRVITVLGDRHARVFSEISRRRAVPRTWIDLRP